ncbi:MAG: Fe(2+) transporter permease subunit FeoB [Magnetococcales bacterium]|nr:Fe(2+) transporter permease subunit FeoB [Magnetococcales bacterium]MBF0114216.1 Fe(2+) transporter permease subunit FeoB [Magnetococcales bacterium]
MQQQTVIGIVGNPNCGKSTLFNRLTSGKQQVGNWPGVTVERKEGLCRVEQTEVTIVDLPGVYSLAASSLDEQVARDFILAKEYNLIINIVDASNLERNLYLTTQLMEMRVPMVVVLNMMDVAKVREVELDIVALSRLLGCPVLPVVAKKRDGIEELLSRMALFVAKGGVNLPTRPALSADLETAVSMVQSALIKEPATLHLDTAWLALKLIEGDGSLPTMAWGRQITALVTQVRAAIEENSGLEADILVAEERYRFIGQVMAGGVKRRGSVSHRLTERLDTLFLNRWLGIPIFLGVLYLMFLFTISLGGVFIDFFDILFNALFVEGFREVLKMVNSPEWLTTLLADGVGGSIQTLATFIPPIGFMFIFLSWLEDSGYMARAAFILDRLLRFIGLPGKAFIPMMVGFGCNVPAILGTRTLENQRDRTLTIMMNPFMSCGARMPVYALFAAAFFPHNGQNVVFALYLTGVAFAILTGLILKHTLLQGEPSPFVMELPLYHLPAPATVLRRAWDRLQGFLTRASRVLIPVIVILSFFNSMGMDGSFGNANRESSVLSAASRQITPLFTPMGIKEENWPATVGLFIGVFAKEAVVGSLDALYGQMAPQSADGKEEAVFSLSDKVVEAVASIGNKFNELGGALFDPMGLTVEEFDSLDDAANAKKVATGTFGAMVQLFDGTTGAMAYLLFVLLYFPCVAATSAVYQETGWRWTLFVAVWTTSIAWSVATFYYQAATYANHPLSSTLWVASLSLVWMVVIGIMRAVSLAKAAAPSGRLACEEA